MPIWMLLRRNWGLWAMPISVVIVITMKTNQTDWFDGYAPWAAAQRAYSLIVLGMIVALCGAAEGSWMRRSKLVTRPARRGLLARFGIPVLLAWFPTALVFVIATATAGGAGAISVWVSSLFSLFAWTCVGFALGIALRPVVALPMGLLLAFFWFAFTPSMEPPWFRHLSGTWDGCCSLSEAPSRAVSIGIVGLAATMILASGIFVLGWSKAATRRSGYLAVAALILLGGGVASYLVAGKVSYYPVEPRQDQVACFSGKPEICVWPEHVSGAQEIVAQIHAITDRWSGFGVAIPTRLSEAAGDAPTSDTVRLIYSSAASPAQRVMFLAQGVAQGCEAAKEEDGDALHFILVRDWLAHESGDPSISSMLGDPATLQGFLEEPHDTQVRRINDYLSASQSC